MRQRGPGPSGVGFGYQETPVADTYGRYGKCGLETRVDGWMDGWVWKGLQGAYGPTEARRSRWALEVLRVVCMTWLTFINDLTDDLDGRAVGYPMNLSLLLRLGLFLVTQAGWRGDGGNPLAEGRC